MAAFVSNIFNAAGTSFAARLLPQVQKTLLADTPALARRAALMSLAQGFMSEDIVPHMKSLIKFAFVETT
jgi:hypothetical protein